MPTLIRLKRKKTAGTTNTSSVKLHSGEPVYNLAEKKLYIGGATANDKIPEMIPKQQKHIAEVTEEHPVVTNPAKNAGDAVVSFSVGEASDNSYVKVVNNVDVARGIILDEIYFGNATKKNNLASAMGLTSVPKGTVFFQEVE